MALRKEIAKAVLPKSLHKWLRIKHHEHVFSRFMRKFIKDPIIMMDNKEVLSNLIYGWGNESWGAPHEYLTACLKAVHESKGPVLECGSGLSTLLMGIVAQRSGNAVWTLEHDEYWGHRVRNCLEYYEIKSVKMAIAPLRTYGQFDWYNPPLHMMPCQFSVVVCDGPPDETRGGRFGLLPVMKNYISDGCIILLDDIDREQERGVASRWASAFNASIETRGIQRPFAQIVISKNDINSLA